MLDGGDAVAFLAFSNVAFSSAKTRSRLGLLYQIVCYIGKRFYSYLKPSASCLRLNPDGLYLRGGLQWVRVCDFFGMRRVGAGCGRGEVRICGGVWRRIRGSGQRRCEHETFGISSGRRSARCFDFCGGQERSKVMQVRIKLRRERERSIRFSF